MDATLKISSDQISEEALQALTRDLSNTLSREANVAASLVEETASSGQRGDPITLGTILLTFITSGALVGLFNVVKSYLERDSSLVIEVDRGDGRKLNLRSQNVGQASINQTLGQLREFFQESPATGRRYAVLIGSSQFPDEPRLENLRLPENDVDGLDEILSTEDRGDFTSVVVLKNRPSSEALRSINQVLSQAERDDLVLIYYSGHGKLNRAGYLHLATVDTVLDILEATSVPVQTLKNFIDVSPSNKVILILDCCYSGAIGAAFTRGGMDDQLQLMSSGRGTYIMTASTGVQVALERESDQYGVFTKHLIEGIQEGEADKDGDGLVTMDELYQYVRRTMRQDGAQEPMKWDLNVAGDDLVISRSGRIPWQERRNRIRDRVLALAQEGAIPNVLLHQALEVIELRPDQMSGESQVYSSLLDQLFEEHVRVGDFIGQWYRVDSAASAAPAPPQNPPVVRQEFPSEPGQPDVAATPTVAPPSQKPPETVPERLRQPSRLLEEWIQTLKRLLSWTQSVRIRIGISIVIGVIGVISVISVGLADPPGWVPGASQTTPNATPTPVPPIVLAAGPTGVSPIVLDTEPAVVPTFALATAVPTANPTPGPAVTPIPTTDVSFPTAISTPIPTPTPETPFPTGTPPSVTPPLISAPPQFFGSWGTFGNGAGQFKNPRGVAVDSDGIVYVVDIDTHQVQTFDADGQFLTLWGSRGGGDGQFREPRGIGIDGKGNVYVADTLNHRIQKFTSDGQFLTQWGKQGIGDGEFQCPSDIVVGASQNVYVVDSCNNRIQKFSSGGQFLTKWGSAGNGEAKFQDAESVATDGEGNVYVVEKKNYRVQKFNSDGVFLTQWGSRGSGDGQFLEPEGIAVDQDGILHVSDVRSNRIQAFTNAGQFLYQWGSSGNGDGQFRMPTALAADSPGNIFVADSDNHRVQRFRTTPQGAAR